MSVLGELKSRTRMRTSSRAWRQQAWSSVGSLFGHWVLLGAPHELLLVGGTKCETLRSEATR
jgi:hypothetical protein